MHNLANLTKALNKQRPTIVLVRNPYLFVAFLVLGAKITGFVSISWWLATVMLWAPVALIAAMVVLTVVFVLVMSAVEIFRVTAPKVSR